MTRIAPSILSADYGLLADEIGRIEPDIDMVHIDVMDGHFVPNITVGAPVVKSLRSHTDVYFDCHLMIAEPAKYLEDFARAGADGCSVHLEVGDTRLLVEAMRELRLDVGLAVNPDTDFEQYEEFLPLIDMLLVMTVQPGFGGQEFRRDVMPKLRRSYDKIGAENLSVKIEVDGGVDVDTAPVAAANGADTFVAGSAIYGASDAAAAARELREVVERTRR